MVLNPAKCYYVLIGDHDEPDKINLLIKKLSFYVHIKTLYKQAAQNFSTLARISSYLTLDQGYY